jgi:hypothetical protein
MAETSNDDDGCVVVRKKFGMATATAKTCSSEDFDDTFIFESLFFVDGLFGMDLLTLS